VLSPKAISKGAEARWRDGCHSVFQWFDLELPVEDDAYDVVYHDPRSLNLRLGQPRNTGIEECLRVAKPGGTVIFSEGSGNHCVFERHTPALTIAAPR